MKNGAHGQGTETESVEGRGRAWLGWEPGRAWEALTSVHHGCAQRPYPPILVLSL